jgi:RimJ/RimL family protein N-acetyltransferase
VKINSDDLIIAPPIKEAALEHMLACKDTKRNLGDYLDWGIDAPSWSFKQHLMWISAAESMKLPYKSNAVFWNDKLVGMFDMVEGADPYGVQLLYWVRGNYQGNGIATAVVEMLAENAFLGPAFSYLEIHVDQANVGSRRVPEKLGFSIEENYQMSPMGTKGTGEMIVFVKQNPYSRIIRPAIKEENQRVFGWSQMRRLQNLVAI